MRVQTTGALLAACCLILCLSPLVGAQMLYTMDGMTGIAWEHPLAAGPPCGQPTSNPFFWGFVNRPPPGCPPGSAVLAPVPPLPNIIGGIDVDRLTDIIYITDGNNIEEFLGGSVVGATPPGSPVNSYAVPPGLFGQVTALAVDGIGWVPGTPTLWLSDGFRVMGVTPGAPGCLPATVIFPAFQHGLGPSVVISDLTWDPFTGTLWVSDTLGWIHQMAVGGGPAGPSWPVTACGLAAPLQGIAYDVGSLAKFAFVGAQMAPAVFVTDGFNIAYIDVNTGLQAPPTFYAPTPCTPVMMMTQGLAYAAKGITYGAGGGNLLVTSSGQSSSPGPTFTLYAVGTTPGSVMWATVGANALAPGYFCPPLMAVGQPLWVDFITPPGQMILLGPTPPLPGVMTIPAAIPPGVPNGAAIFVQFWEDLSGGAGGPFVSSDAIGFTITMP
jgi:hypothetical protein